MRVYAHARLSVASLVQLLLRFVPEPYPFFFGHCDPLLGRSCGCRTSAVPPSAVPVQCCSLLFEMREPDVPAVAAVCVSLPYVIQRTFTNAYIDLKGFFVLNLTAVCITNGHFCQRFYRPSRIFCQVNNSLRCNIK